MVLMTRHSEAFCVSISFSRDSVSAHMINQPWERRMRGGFRVRFDARVFEEVGGGRQNDSVVNRPADYIF